MAEKCEIHALVEDAIKRHDHEIRDLDNRLTENEKTVAVFDVELRNAIKSMSTIPEYMEKLNKSMFGVENTVDNLKQEFDGLKCSIDEKIEGIDDEIHNVGNKVEIIDQEGKINIRKLFQKHFEKIILSALALVYLLDKFL